MGQSTEELRSEIEQTRQSMTADVDAFTTALRLDLFDAGDFGATRER